MKSSILTLDVMHQLLSALAQERPLSDFQHALAWKIHASIPDASIRLELPVRGDANTYLDLLVRLCNESYAMELKYKTSSITLDNNGEKFSLRSQSAQDTGRYDFLKDITRLERYVRFEQDCTGYALFLSNDALYWKKPGAGITSEQFSIHDGRQINASEIMRWANHAGSGSIKGREQGIVCESSYACSWREYSIVGSSQFRYLLLAIR